METSLNESLNYVKLIESLNAKNDSNEFNDSITFYKDQDWSLLVDDNGLVNDDDFDFFDESPKTSITTQQTPITPYTPITPSTLTYSFIDNTLDEFKFQLNDDRVPNNYKHLNFNKSLKLFNYGGYNGKYSIYNDDDNKFSNNTFGSFSYPPQWYNSISKPHLESKKRSSSRNSKDSDVNFIKNKRKRRSPSLSSSSSDIEMEDLNICDDSTDDEYYELDFKSSFPPTPLTNHSQQSRNLDSEHNDNIRLTINDCKILTDIKLPYRDVVVNSRQKADSDYFKKCLSIPKFSLGFDDDKVIQTSPIGIEYWDKAGFMPFGGRKKITLIIKSDENLGNFSEILKQSYLNFNLGTLSIITNIKDDDIIKIKNDDENIIIINTFNESLSDSLIKSKHYNNVFNAKYLVITMEDINDIMKSNKLLNRLLIKLYEMIDIKICRYLGNKPQQQSFYSPAFVISRSQNGKHNIKLNGDDNYHPLNHFRNLHITYHYNQLNKELIIVIIDEFGHFFDVRIETLSHDSNSIVIETVINFSKIYERKTSIKWFKRIIKVGEMSVDECKC